MGTHGWVFDSFNLPIYPNRVSTPPRRARDSHWLRNGYPWVGNCYLQPTHGYTHPVGIQPTHRVCSQPNYFKVSKSLKSLPKYLIWPRLSSHPRVGKGWDIQGEMVVYEPIEWIPIATIVQTHPRSVFEREYFNESVSTTSSEIYGKLATELHASASGDLGGVKVEAKLSAEFKIEKKINSENTVKITTKGVLGKKVVNEVWLTMSLKVKPVYSRRIRLWNNNIKGKHQIMWDNDFWASYLPVALASQPSLPLAAQPYLALATLTVSNRTLDRVKDLQFSNIAMSGDGASGNIRFQVLPVLDEDSKELKDLHIAFSNVGDETWFVYNPKDSYGIELEEPEIVAWPDWEPKSWRFSN
jgi:hypothetical protein